MLAHPSSSSSLPYYFKEGEWRKSPRAVAISRRHSLSLSFQRRLTFLYISLLPDYHYVGYSYGGGEENIPTLKHPPPEFFFIKPSLKDLIRTEGEWRGDHLCVFLSLTHTHTFYRRVYCPEVVYSAYIRNHFLNRSISSARGAGCSF